MFNETLLDSSPARAPVLEHRHRLIAALVGVGGFLVAHRALALILGAPHPSTLLAQSAIIGMALACYTLMLFYVYTDARRLRLRAWMWAALTCVGSVVGFLLYLTYSAARTRDWRRLTMPAAYMLEVALVGVLVVMPLVYTEALPRAVLSQIIRVPSAPPAPPAAPRNQPIRTIHRIREADLVVSPVLIPKVIAVIKDDTDAERQENVPRLVGLVPGGIPGGTGTIPYGIPPVGPPPPPTPAGDTTVSRQIRIRVGGQVEAARLIFQVKPEYPPLAKMARIQGTVRLEALISKDGTIENLKVLAGHPLLVKAAIDAVARWRYQPTLLNGDPVKVVTNIEVNFALE